MKIKLTLAVVLLLSALRLDARRSVPESFDYAREIEQLSRLDLLPMYRTNQVVTQESSYDRTFGNNDGFNGTYSFIRKEGRELVIAEFKGAGVINRIWTPTPSQDTIRFYFDDETKARIEMPFSDLFSGKVYPFVNPICGNEIGGFYCYLPIPFAKSVKITMQAERVMFYQVQQRSLKGMKVDSYSPAKAEAVRPSIESTSKIWNNQSAAMNEFGLGRSANMQCKTETFILKPGEEHSFFNDTKGGRIVGLEMDGGESFFGNHKDILLTARWDNDPVDAIHAPVADFFGYGYGKPAVRSLMLGSRGTTNYSYMPAPYDQSARMALRYERRENTPQHPISITTKVYYTQQPREAASEGRFYSLWRREPKVKDGEMYTFASIEGKGHYVGSIQWAQSLKPGMTLFFEGDDSISVDGVMTMHGTGSEDYFNGGWYALLDRWDRGVSMPLHGALDYSLPMARTGGYRFYTTDKMSFEQRCFIAIEHGPDGNQFPVDYGSMAYYYADRSPKAIEPPTAATRTVPSLNTHTFFPQLMLYTMHEARVEFKSFVEGYALLSVDKKDGFVRVMMDEIPEGRYKLYMDYRTRADGAPFSVWQRQKQLSGWFSAKSEKEEKLTSRLMGEIEITKQTNSISIHLRHDKGGDVLPLDLITLERID